jgi:hypothetical protein
MSTASAQPRRGSWYQRTFTSGRPFAPWGVRTATTIMVIFGILGLAQAVMLVAGGVAALSDGESPGLVALLGGGSLVLAVFYLWLAYQTRKGRRWAWLTTLVLLSLPVVLGLALFVYGVVANDEPLVGLGLAGPPLLLVLLLAGPRGSREYFVRPNEYATRWRAREGGSRS